MPCYGSERSIILNENSRVAFAFEPQTMKMIFRGIICLELIVLLALGIREANAEECIISGPRYQLKSDTVEWRITIRRGHTCVRGVRFNTVTIDTINLISAPQFGKVTLLGSGFSYSTNSDFHGEDSFAIGISGTINGTKGSSTIWVLVSAIGVSPAPGVAAPDAHNRIPAQAPADNASPAPSVESTAPLPTGISPPACPIWDWSSGAPPPMRPPFDKSKLYCPPPPFNPPGPPIGCICPQ